MTTRSELSPGELAALMATAAALLKAITELVKILKRRERADLRLLSDLED